MSWASSSSGWVGGGDDGGSSNPKSSSSSSGDVATSSSLSGTGTGGGGKEKLGDILMLSCSLGECGVKGKYPSLYLLSAHCFGKGHGEGTRRDINPNFKNNFFLLLVKLWWRQQRAIFLFKFRAAWRKPRCGDDGGKDK